MKWIDSKVTRPQPKTTVLALSDGEAIIAFYDPKADTPWLTRSGGAHGVKVQFWMEIPAFASASAPVMPPPIFQGEPNYPYATPAPTTFTDPILK